MKLLSRSSSVVHDVAPDRAEPHPLHLLSMYVLRASSWCLIRLCYVVWGCWVCTCPELDQNAHHLLYWACTSFWWSTFHPKDVRAHRSNRAPILSLCWACAFKCFDEAFSRSRRTPYFATTFVERILWYVSMKLFLDREEPRDVFWHLFFERVSFWCRHVHFAGVLNCQVIFRACLVLMQTRSFCWCTELSGKMVPWKNVVARLLTLCYYRLILDDACWIVFETLLRVGWRCYYHGLCDMPWKTFVLGVVHCCIRWCALKDSCKNLKHWKTFVLQACWRSFYHELGDLHWRRWFALT